MAYELEIISGLLPYLFIPLPFYIKKRGGPDWLVRKSVHITANTFLVFYFAILKSSINVLVSVAIFITLLVLISFPPKIRLLQRILEISTRDGEKTLFLLINSSSTFVVILIILLIFNESPHIFIPAILAIAWGDGLGEVIGKPYGRHKYEIFEKKSIEGSIGVFVGILLGTVIGFIVGEVSLSQYWWVLLIVCFVGTFIEAISFSYLDNIFLPSVVVIILYFLIN